MAPRFRSLDFRTIEIRYSRPARECATDDRYCRFQRRDQLLILSGSLYMLQVYDVLIPSRSLPTLSDLSLIVLFAYLMPGYFKALRTRMLGRVERLSI